MAFSPFWWLPASFLLGSLPTGYILGRWLKGIDIRQAGSGNVGATNVFRTVGKGAGIATLAVDIFKGGLPVWLSLRFFKGDAVPMLTGLAAVSGHTWSPFVCFKGGKGVATSAGVLAALLPIPTAVAVAAFGVVFALVKHVSAGSIAGSVALPIAALATQGASPRALLAAVLGALVVVRHIPNIKRLCRGEELSIGRAASEREQKKP